MGILEDIAALPGDWHGAGSVTPAVLEALERRVGRVARSLETGTGRTTLLLSHLSAAHTVFAKDDEGDGGSLRAVQGSPLLREATTTFVVGPTQRTLPAHEHDGPLDLAYLDGPHAYPFPDLEYWAVYPHVREGGWLVVDDLQIPSIGNLWDVVRSDAMWEEAFVVEDTGFLRRTAAPAIDPFGEGWWEQGYNARPRFTHRPPADRARAFASRMRGRLAGR